MASHHEGWNDGRHTPRKQQQQSLEDSDHGELKPPRSPYKSGPRAWNASGEKNATPKDSYRVHPNKLFQDAPLKGLRESFESKEFESGFKNQVANKKLPPNPNARKASPLMRTFDGSYPDYSKMNNPVIDPVSIPTQALVDSQDNQSRIKMGANPVSQSGLRRTQSMPRNPLKEQFDENRQNHIQQPPHQNDQKNTQMNQGFLHPERARVNNHPQPVNQGHMQQPKPQFTPQYAHNQEPQQQAQHFQAAPVQTPQTQFPNTYKTQLNDVQPKQDVNVLEHRGLWSSVSRKMKAFRSRSQESQKHIHRWPSYEPPVYILPGELLADYIIRIKRLKGEIIDENGISLPPEDDGGFRDTEQSIRTLPNHGIPFRNTGNTLGLDDVRPSDRDSRALSATLAGIDFPSMMTSIPAIPSEDEPSGLMNTQSARPTWQQESFAPAYQGSNQTPQPLTPTNSQEPYQTYSVHQPPIQNNTATRNNQQRPPDSWTKRNEDPLRMTPKFNEQLKPQQPTDPRVIRAPVAGLAAKGDEDDTNLLPPVMPVVTAHPRPPMQNPSVNQAPPANQMLPPPSQFNNGQMQLFRKPEDQGGNAPIVINSAGQQSNAPLRLENMTLADNGGIKIVSLPRSRSASDLSKNNTSELPAFMPIIVPATLQPSNHANAQSVQNLQWNPRPQLSPSTQNQESTKTNPQANPRTEPMNLLQLPQAGPPQTTAAPTTPILIQSKPTGSLSQQQDPHRPALATVGQRTEALPSTTQSVTLQRPVQPPNTQPLPVMSAAQPLLVELQQDNAALQRKVLEVAGLLDRERDEASRLRAQVDGAQSKQDSLHKEYMKLKSLEPEFARLQRAEQELKQLLANSNGRLAENEGMTRRMEADFLGRKNNLENQVRQLQQEIQGLRAAIAAKDSDINRLKAQEIDLTKLKELEIEIARLRLFEREALELRPLRNEIVRLKVIENDYWRLKSLEPEVNRLRGLESEISRLKGIESAYESTRIRLSQAESELSRFHILESEKLKLLTNSSPKIPEMPTADLRDSSPTLQAQLNTSAVLSEMHNSLKDELSALGSLSTLILTKLNEISTKPTTIKSAENPSKLLLTPTLDENSALSQKILDNQKEMESRLKNIELIVTQMGGTEGRASENAKFDDPIKIRLALEKSLDGLKTGEIEDVRLSNPELFAMLQGQFAYRSNRNIETCDKQTEADLAPSQIEMEKMRTELNKLVMERRRADDDYRKLETDFDSLRHEHQQKEEQVQSLSQNVRMLQSKLEQYSRNKVEGAVTGLDSENTQGAQTPALGMMNSGKGSESNGVSDENKINDLIKYFSQVESERGFKAPPNPATPSSQGENVFRMPPQSPAFADIDTHYNTGSAQREASRDKQTPRTAATQDSRKDGSPAEDENVFSPSRARRVQGSINPMLVRKQQPSETGSDDRIDENQMARDDNLHPEDADNVSPVFGRGNPATNAIDRASFGIGFKGLINELAQQNGEIPGQDMYSGHTPTASQDTYRQHHISANSGEDGDIHVVISDNLRDVVLPRFGIENGRRASEDLPKDGANKSNQPQRSPTFQKNARYSADALPTAAALLKLVADKDREIEEARNELQRLQDKVHESEEKRQLEREVLEEEETTQALRKSIKEIVDQLKSGAVSPKAGNQSAPQTPANQPAEPVFFQQAGSKRESIRSSASSSILRDLDDLPVAELRDRVAKMRKEREELARKHRQLQEVSLRSKSALLSRIGLIAESSQKFYDTLKAANSTNSD